LFLVNLICDTKSFTCDHCDLQEIEKLYSLLLSKFTAASIRKFPRKANRVKMNTLINDFINWLQLSDNATPITINIEPSSTDGASTNSPTATPSVTAGDAPSSPLSKRGYQYEHVVEILDAFVQQSQTTLSMASSMLSSQSHTETYQQDRQDDILSIYLPMFVWYQLITCYLRKFDSQYEYHCMDTHCGAKCIYTVESCPHTDCPVKYSRKWATQHDAICPEKLLSCPRVCEVDLGIKRKCMDSHLASECALRPVTCPYQCLGCHSGMSFVLLFFSCYCILFPYCYCCCIFSL
jgi:hypothetical protein